MLTPREVAQLFGVRTTTIARWARAGQLRATLTPGGHRRYRRADIQELLDANDLDDMTPERSQLEADAVRLYDQGWSIRQVAERFGTSYGAVRRILARHVTLRSRGGVERLGPSVSRHPSTDRPDDTSLTTTV